MDRTVILSGSIVFRLTSRNDGASLSCSFLILTYLSACNYQIKPNQIKSSDHCDHVHAHNWGNSTLKIDPMYMTKCTALFYIGDHKNKHK